MKRWLTWRLWNALYYPSRAHPLFRHTTQRNRWRFPASWLSAALILVLFASCLLFFRFPELALSLAFSLGVAVPILLIAAHGSLLALWWAWQISDALLDTRRDERDVLLGTIPGGLLSAGWLISTGLIHRNDWLRQAHRVMRLVLLIVVGLLVVLVLWAIAWVVLAGNTVTANELTLIVGVFSLIALGAAFWFDHIQSILLAPLLGLLLPKLLRDRFLVRVALSLGFPLLQLGTWALAWIFYRGWSLLIFALVENLLLGYALAMSLGVLTFFLLRETLLAFLWRALLHVYRVEPREFFAVVGG